MKHIYKNWAGTRPHRKSGKKNPQMMESVTYDNDWHTVSWCL